RHCVVGDAPVGSYRASSGASTRSDRGTDADTHADRGPAFATPRQAWLAAVGTAWHRTGAGPGVGGARAAAHRAAISGTCRAAAQRSRRSRGADGGGF